MPTTTNATHHWAVVLAGGDGRRLQRLTQLISGDARPKQFCNFLGDSSLLQQTRERIAPVFDKERTLFALARAHEPYYHGDLVDVHASRQVIQPANRGTAIAMALSLRRIARQDEDALVAFFPSDHHYLNVSAFQSSVAFGLRAVEEYPHFLLMLGAEPTYPEVEYDWIRPGRTLVDSLTHPLRRVERFWEKPDLPRAMALMQRGCLWNTFVVLGRASAFLELFRATVPLLMQALDRDLANGDLEDIFESLPVVDASSSVFSRIPDRLLVLHDARSGWTDLGSPRRVMDLLTREGVRPPWLSPDVQARKLYA